MKIKAILTLCAIATVLGVILFFINQPKTPENTTQPQPYVWDFNMDALKHITITLPKNNPPLSESWIRHDDKYFYFDVANGSKVDMQRWGGGIPLLLSGPGSDRLIADNVNDSDLAQFGLVNPNIVINLVLNDGMAFDVLVGDATPSGNAYYIKQKNIATVFSVDYTWHDIIQGLVTNPPYEPAAIAVDSFTYVPEAPVSNQPFIIRATVVNTGILKNKEPFELVLKIQGEVVNYDPPKTVIIDGGSRQIVDFAVAGKPAGIYSISLAGKTAKLVIK